MESICRSPVLNILYGCKKPLTTRQHWVGSSPSRAISSPTSTSFCLSGMARTPARSLAVMSEALEFPDQRRGQVGHLALLVGLARHDTRFAAAVHGKRLLGS